MRSLLCLVFSSLMVVMGTAPACGQADDPFGGPDPFGGKPRRVAAGNPFEANPFGRDPFGAQARAKTKVPGQPPEIKIAPGRVPLVIPKLSDAETKIRAALEQKTSFSFVEAPLLECIERIADDHGIPILLHKPALEEIGLTPDLPVTLSVREVSLRSSLRLMLTDFDLTYVVRNEVVMITTEEFAAQSLRTEIYDIPEALVPKADMIVKVVTGTVEPDSWEAVGGPSSIYVLDHLFVVSAPERAHDRFVEFLAKLRDAYQARQKREEN